ncbi:MAG: DUF721 domain-containing protein [Phycisphaerae bacterium]|nr:DUF721 domain-containing protein [Phycisphaerae bacterium]MDP7289990.1 DUF721 domain-containing protein [Phycisphaerae bacterium]
MDDTQLRTLWLQKQPHDRTSHLAGPMAVLMKHKLGKKVRQLSKLAFVWDEVLPATIRDHTALDSFNRGVLTVMVDSASHRYQLKKLLAAGLEKEIRTRFAGPLNKIKLVPGQFCSVDMETGDRRYDV